MSNIYGYVYLTTNLINGKKYIGQHKGCHIDHNYFGSGLLVSKALKLYGKANFSCEILDIAYSKEELDTKEIYWIKQHNAVASNDYYNLDKGGVISGRSFGHEVSDSTREKLRIANLGKKLSEETKQKLSDARKGKYVGDNNNAKLPISRAKLKIANHGENNPSYGKHWFTDGIETVYAYECPQGFVPGRGKHKINTQKLVGRHWYNNGVKSIMAHECPDGYKEGRLIV